MPPDEAMRAPAAHNKGMAIGGGAEALVPVEIRASVQADTDVDEPGLVGGEMDGNNVVGIARQVLALVRDISDHKVHSCHCVIGSEPPFVLGHGAINLECLRKLKVAHLVVVSRGKGRPCIFLEANVLCLGVLGIPRQVVASP